MWTMLHALDLCMCCLWRCARSVMWAARCTVFARALAYVGIGRPLSRESRPQRVEQQLYHLDCERRLQGPEWGHFTVRRLRGCGCSYICRFMRTFCSCTYAGEIVHCSATALSNLELPVAPSVVVWFSNTNTNTKYTCDTCFTCLLVCVTNPEICTAR
jgi:hypothetical protein